MKNNKEKEASDDEESEYTYVTVTDSDYDSDDLSDEEEYTIPVQSTEELKTKKIEKEKEEKEDEEWEIYDRDNSVFYFENIMKDKYKITRCRVNGEVYRIRHFNGFMQLLLEPYAEAYFLCQASNQYLTPDWKFHVSLNKEDYQKGWDLLVDIFFKYKLLAMKIQVQPDWKKFGRGITIYLYTKHKVYDDFVITYQWKPHSEVLKAKFSDAFQCSPEKLFTVAKEIEEVLEKNKIRTMKCERGDFALGKFVSIRNESFVKMKVRSRWKDENGNFPWENRYIYPPDECGFNSRGHDNFPLVREKVFEDFLYLMPEVSSKPSDLIWRVDLPQFGYQVIKYDKVLQKIQRRKKKSKELVKNFLKGLCFTALFNFEKTNQIKAIDLMFIIFEDKKKWKKGSRSFIMQCLEMVKKNSHSLEIREYVETKLEELRKFYSKKKTSHAKRTISKFIKK